MTKHPFAFALASTRARAVQHARVGIILFAVLALAGSARAASPDEQARDLFLAQRYSEALVIYQRLRAESQHPTYLRNIGRCHQMMRQPAPAIAAFESYLREAPGLGAPERTEVEGYIAEMRRLEASTTPPPGAGPSPGASPALTPAAPAETNTPLVATAASAPSTSDAAGDSSGASSGESSILRKWWFWAGVGALVVASGIVIAVSTSDDRRLPCPSGAVCP
jgi:hypothetical protein